MHAQGPSGAELGQLAFAGRALVQHRSARRSQEPSSPDGEGMVRAILTRCGDAILRAAVAARVTPIASAGVHP
jgi:hypothetical protein